MNVVYFLQHPEDGYIKIGTTHHLERRAYKLRGEYGCNLTFLGAHEGGFEKERELHSRFGSDWRFGEWFRPSNELKAYIAANVTIQSLAAPAIARRSKKLKTKPEQTSEYTKQTASQIRNAIIPRHWRQPTTIINRLRLIYIEGGSAAFECALKRTLHHSYPDSVEAYLLKQGYNAREVVAA